MSTANQPTGLAAALFGKTRRAILSLLYGRTDEEFYTRHILRIAKTGHGAGQRELKHLSETGIIRRKVRGQQVYFQANPDSPIFHELKSLILKTAGIGDALRNGLAQSADHIKVAFIYGSIAKGEEGPRSDIDLLVVGDVAFSEVVANLQEAQRILCREVNPTVYPPNEFRSKLRANHHFLTSILKGPRIYLIGDENELRRLAAKRLARRA
jgi:predicted nucleotidyltransferase